MRSILVAVCVVCVLGAVPSISRAESYTYDAAVDAGVWDADLVLPDASESLPDASEPLPDAASPAADAFASAPDARSSGIDAGGGGTSGGGCSVGSARTGSIWVLALGAVALLISRRRR